MPLCSISTSGRPRKISILGIRNKRGGVAGDGFRDVGGKLKIGRVCIKILLGEGLS